MFRFSIRELMLVTLVVALALAWWAERTKREISDERLGQADRDAKFLLEYVEPDYAQSLNYTHLKSLEWQYGVTPLSRVPSQKVTYYGD
jgi:hypothetical protein